MVTEKRIVFGLVAWNEIFDCNKAKFLLFIAESIGIISISISLFLK